MGLFYFYLFKINAMSVFCYWRYPGFLMAFCGGNFLFTDFGLKTLQFVVG
ncbi:hypothetical protein B194_0819 [Serratia plymuthica A30]|nr:hypothetical protein B194_0819 [Serratia plymuthica A30]